MTSQTTTTLETLDSQSSQPRQPNTAQIFARHETFHPRFGWLKKGFDKAAQDSGIFLREDAPVLLGVGKNMCDRFGTGAVHLKSWKMTLPPTLGLSYWDRGDGMNI